jgi:GAF domain-containing protein
MFAVADPSSSDQFDLLISTVQQLSLARNIQAIQDLVKGAARRLVSADGATFVLREGDLCHYVDEDAVSPLWKGRRFPMSTCISGWVMLNRLPAVIEDVYADSRVLHDAYRPTFVRSLAMMPVRTLDPIAAIGVYWSQRHRSSPRELRMLEALSDSTSLAMENVQVHARLRATPASDARGLRPKMARICAWTRRVELDGQWVSFETFLAESFGIQVTHTISEEGRRLVAGALGDDPVALGNDSQ